MEKIALDGGVVIDFINYVATDISLKNAEAFIHMFYDIGKYID